MTTMLFHGFLNTPGMEAFRETFENVIWRDSYEYNKSFMNGVVLSDAVRDTGNVGNEQTLRAGLPLGRRYGSLTGAPPYAYEVDVWDPDASDGRQDLFGILIASQSNVDGQGGADYKWQGLVLTGGLVRASAVIDPGSVDSSVIGQPSPGLVGAPNGNLLRHIMNYNGRFIFDDGQHDGFGSYKSVVNWTAGNFTLTEQDAGKLFVISNGGVTVTLPAITERCKGLEYHVMSQATGGTTLAGAVAGDVLSGASPTNVAEGGLGTALGVVNAPSGSGSWAITEIPPGT